MLTNLWGLYATILDGFNVAVVAYDHR